MTPNPGGAPSLQATFLIRLDNHRRGRPHALRQAARAGKRGPAPPARLCRPGGRPGPSGTARPADAEAGFPKYPLEAEGQDGTEKPVTGNCRIIQFRPRIAPESERRRFVRISEPIEAVVKGEDAEGSPFELKTILRNLGAGGLYLSIPRRLSPGDSMDIVIRLCRAGRPGARAPLILAHSRVLRTEARADGEYGLAVEFLSHRFL
jgi:hypothetical protein